MPTQSVHAMSLLQTFSSPIGISMILLAVSIGIIAHATWQALAAAMLAGIGLFIYLAGKHSPNAPLEIWAYQIVFISVSLIVFTGKHLLSKRG
jgi:hypothetical protein